MRNHIMPRLVAQNGPMTTTVRPGQPDDHAAAFEVWRASLTARDGRPPAEQIQRVVRENLAAPGTWLLVAEDAGVIVAIVTARDGAEDGGRGPASRGLCHIEMLFVAPDRWGAGIGGELLDAALDEVRRRGYVRAQLWVVQDNERATRLYARRGFRHSGRVASGDAGEAIGLWAVDLE